MGLRDGTPPNKGKTPFEQGGKNTFRTRKKTPTNKEKNTNKQGKKTPPNKGNTSKQGEKQQTRKTPPNKKTTFRARETPFEQGGIFQSNVKVYKWQEFPVKAGQL